MIINKYKSSDSINKQIMSDYDKECLAYLTEKYGGSELFLSLNEYSGRFDRTAGSKVTGLSGLAQAVGNFALTQLIFLPVAWPFTLITAIGALSHRIQTKFEDKNSWLNRLHPQFWVDYLATPHKSKSSDTGDGLMSKVKSALGIGAGVATGAAAGAYLGTKLGKDEKEEIDVDAAKKNVMNNVFVPYWVTLSNGEIVRVRANSPENAKMFANMIIAYTLPCYKILNEKISRGMPKFTFRFSDGELCYWSADTQQIAHKEALNNRKRLCEGFNKMSPDLIPLEDLEKPKVVGKVDVERGESVKIELPEKDKFLNVTTEQPNFEEKKPTRIPKPVYAYGTLDNYRATSPLFTFNVPSYEERDAIDAIRYLYRSSGAIAEILNGMSAGDTIFEVKMNDGDVYKISTNTLNHAESLAMSIYHDKVESIKKTLSGSSLEEYEDLLEEFGKELDSISNSQIKELETDKQSALFDRFNDENKKKDFEKSNLYQVKKGEKSTKKNDFSLV